MTRNDDALGMRVLIGYGLPAMGLQATSLIASMYVLKFATESLWIAPALVGSILAASRIWDAISDPLIGHASDRTCSRLGRRRPWMLLGAPVLAISFVAIWQGPGEPGTLLRTVWFAAAILAFYTGYTLVSVPHTSLGASLSQDPNDRNRIYASRGILQNVGVLLALVALYVLEDVDSPGSATARIAAAVGLASAIAIAWGAWITPEPTAAPPSASGDERAPALLDTFRDVVANRSARLLLSAIGLQELALGALLVILPFASDYLLRAPGQTAIYMVAFVLAMTASLPVWVRLGNRLGGIRAWRLGNAIEGLGFLPIGIAGPGDQLLVGLAATLIGVGHGAGRVLAMSALARVADEDAQCSGRAREGAFFAASNFSEKCALALAAFGVGLALEASGFIAGEAPAPATISVVRALASVVPCVLILSSCGLLSREDRQARRAISGSDRTNGRDTLRRPLVVHSR